MKKKTSIQEFIQNLDVNLPEIEKFLDRYRLTEKRIKIRKKIDKRMPFLKNIRFRWWKKSLG